VIAFSENWFEAHWTQHTSHLKKHVFLIMKYAGLSMEHVYLSHSHPTAIYACPITFPWTSLEIRLGTPRRITINIHRELFGLLSDCLLAGLVIENMLGT